MRAVSESVKLARKPVYGPSYIPISATGTARPAAAGRVKAPANIKPATRMKAARRQRLIDAMETPLEGCTPQRTGQLSHIADEPGSAADQTAMPDPDRPRRTTGGPPAGPLLCVVRRLRRQRQARPARMTQQISTDAGEPGRHGSVPAWTEEASCGDGMIAARQERRRWRSLRGSRGPRSPRRAR